MPVHYTKIIAGQEVTVGMIKCLKETIDLAMELAQIPVKFQEINLKGVCLSRKIANVKDAPESASTFLRSPDYLMNSLNQPDIDPKVIWEAADKLEEETEALKHPTDRQSDTDTTHVEDFIWDARVLKKPDARSTGIRTRIQLDTGSTASFVSQRIVNRANLVPFSDATDSIFMTINNQPVTVRQQVWVEWYAINQAVTRKTLCYVMPDLPVDMLIGSNHIVEYNMLAIKCARVAFLAKPNFLKKDKEFKRTESEAKQHDATAKTMAQEAAQKALERAQKMQGATTPEDRPGPTVSEEGQGPTVLGKPEHMQPPKVQRPWKSDNLTPTIESMRSATSSPVATRRSSDRPKIPRTVPNSPPAGIPSGTPPRTPRAAGPPPNPATVLDSFKEWGGGLLGKFSKSGPAS